MSILLSGYFPEGIVFAADKNATITAITNLGQKRFVEPTATKVLSWPNSKANVGFVGLGQLTGLPMDEWMRIFIAGTRNFNNIDELAIKLHNDIQSDFDKEYSNQSNYNDLHLIIHLGGFGERKGIKVPVMYHIYNHEGLERKSGLYKSATSKFKLSEEFEKNFKEWWKNSNYPEQAQERLSSLVSRKKYMWFNNGANIGAFNVFKGVIWQSLNAIEEAGFAKHFSGIDARIAFCKMAVEVFGIYFTHHYFPDERYVGGGVDVVFIEWL
jgi:hypothetical protein